MSVLLRLKCPADQLMHLTCATAVAACDAVEKAVGIRPGVKWINDLVYGRRKLAGILTELGLAKDGSVDYAIMESESIAARKKGISRRRSEPSQLHWK